MISVQEAQRHILEHVRPLSPRSVSLGPACLGRVLAEDVASDLFMPPFDKALMDGYAVRSADLSEGRAELAVIEEITAGHTPLQPVSHGQAARIMTGAPIPEGADAIVVVERAELLPGDKVRIEDRPPKPRQHILSRGQEMREGEVILRAGTILRGQEFGILSTVGRTSVAVHPAPRAAIVVTGDELIEPEQRPGPGQIRNSNGPMLVGLVAHAGGEPGYLGIARDDVASLRTKIGEGLRFDVLVLSGGVSAGKKDLVPGVLEVLGVRPLFHKVSMKPGKPVFFGARGNALVFGLPGNPVSSMACFELFVRPALRRLAGHADAGPRMVRAELASAFHYTSDRPTYHPARLEDAAAMRRVHIVPWFGSSDLRALARANALAVLPADESDFRAGRTLDVLPLACP